MLSVLRTQPLWADLHNHNDVGYGTGSLERALAIAQQRLDVWAFTAHGYWFDMPGNADDPAVKRHMAGFRRVRDLWPTVLATFEGASHPGRFIAMAGFEWHSTNYGDLHVLVPDRLAELPEGAMLPAELRSWARQNNALLIPHHLAYPPGARGVNWDEIDDELSPVAEVFSEHGASEGDDIPWPMDGHSMSPRSTLNTWREGLRRGLRLGAVASTDNHEGCPGAYSEGLTGLWAKEFNQKAVLQALRQRRCFAVTGDRIVLDWSCLDAPMGATTELRGTVLPVRCHVVCWDELDCIDLFLNGCLWKRWTPGVNLAPVTAQPQAVQRVVLRERWGWGRMGETNVHHWEGYTRVIGGQILATMPGFASVPPGGGSDGAMTRMAENEISWSSRTSRSYPQPYDQIALEIEGTPDTRLYTVISCQSDSGQWRRECVTTLGELALASREVHMAAPPLSPTFQWTRALPRRTCVAEVIDNLSLPDDRAAEKPLYLYMRVRQRNGQMAWTSPIWLQ